MNKYQALLDELCIGCSLTECKGGNTNCQLYLGFKELVDKATPKKPEYEGDGYYKGEIVYDTWICPSCGERYEVDYHDYDYCPKCGQHIDLTQEEEEEYE